MNLLTQTLKGLVSRPIANFHPCQWGDRLLHISHSDEDVHSAKEPEIKQLKVVVKERLSAAKSKPSELLNLIDALERLGVAYHFESAIDESLQQVYETNYLNDQDHLYHASVAFRIFRQHGFNVSCEVFNKFKDENGNFKGTLQNDVAGILSLYEASQVRVHGDDILDEALEFTKTCLKSTANKVEPPLVEQVAHALHHSLHKGMPRLEASHYISVYEKDPSHDTTLLRLAKLDFNLIQSLHRKELQDFARWWKGLHLKVPFSRDRLAEAYFWIIGVYYEPQLATARKIMRKIFKATSLLDDTYDAYGTIEELELLTDAVQRWDQTYVDKLPDHVKWSYQVLLEAFDEAEQELAKEGTSFRLYYAKEQMKKLCQAFLQEAKWCNEKYIPTYDEYIKVALITSPYPFGVVASFLGMGEIATKEAFEWVCQDPMPKPVRAAATIIRLLDDIYGHEFEQKRKHVASAVQCYKERHGMLKEEEIHKELTKQVEDACKDINQAMLKPYDIPKPLLTRILNLARSAEVIYKGEDGYTMPSQAMKQNVATVLFNPIPI